MSNFQQQYKNPRVGFGDVDHRRFLRAYKQDETRREVRTRTFDKNRKLQDVSAPASPQHGESTSNVKNDRMNRLVKWREERNAKKKLENAKKKPVFKVGIVHHAIYSPVAMNNASTTASKQVKTNVIKRRVTRATEKRLLTKAAISTAKQLTVTPKGIVSKSSGKNSISTKKPTSDIKKQKSFAPANHIFRPPSGLPKMPLFGLVSIEKTPSEKGDFFVQSKSMDLETHDANNQEGILSQKLDTEILDLNATNITRKLKNSKIPRLSSTKKSPEKLVNLTFNTSDTTSKLNKTVTERSLNEQAAENTSQKKRTSLNSTDMGIPSQKTPSSTNKSSEKENCEDLIIFSPYLTLSRGKSNARKEQQLRLGIRRSSGEIPTKDTVMKNLNISVEEEERTAQYFKFLLNKETDRLQELCKKWSDVGLEDNIPEDAVYEINQAIGQTNLLICKKFERFRSLVMDCETGRGEMLVTCRDLQGFWDMTYMEVRDCDSRFEKLEQRRNRGWQEEECAVVKPTTRKRLTTKKQIVSSKPSSLRSLILAARKKKMAGLRDNEESSLQYANLNNGRITPPLSSRKSVGFKENPDTRHNNRRSKSIEPIKSISAQCSSSNSRASLVQKEQLSDKSKRMKSPFAIMKISQMCKTPEVQLDDTISYINSNQTPGKSILKKSEEAINKDRLRSAHKVNFDDQIVLTEVPVDEETQIKQSLAAALNRINNLNLDDLMLEKCINAEKKLDFETEDSDISDNSELVFEVQTLKKEQDKSRSSIRNTSDSNAGPLNDITSAITFRKSSLNNNSKIQSKKSSKIKDKNDTMEIPNINIIPAIPLTNIESPVISEMTSSVINSDVEQGSEIRILRNRIVTTADTPRKSRTSKTITPKKENVSKKENKSPMKLHRRSSSKLSRMNKNNIQLDEDNIIEINENIDKKRRSSRKSVAFNVNCLVCTENKPVLPMTPHSKRRSKTSIRQSRSKNVFDEDQDLETREIVELPPNRVTRRSQMKN